MYKRLTISLVLMGLAAFSLAAGAVAYFSAQGPRTDVSISAGTAALSFEIDEECTDEGHYSVDEWEFVPANWTNVAPGQSQVDCVRITNTGTLPLNLYAHHEAFDLGGLEGAIEFAHWADSDFVDPDTAENSCGWALADSDTYTDGRGCAIGSIAPNGGIRHLRVGLRFAETGNDQNEFQEATLGFDGYITGYPD